MQGPPDPIHAPSIPAAVLAAGERFAAHPAIEEEGHTWSYAQLAADGLQAAKALMATGVQAGDRVAIWAPNCAEWVIAAIGLQSVGAILVPLNTRLKGGEAGFILRNSAARSLFCVSDFLNVNYLDLIRDESLPHLQDRFVLRGTSPRGSVGWREFLARGEAVADEDVLARIQAIGEDDLSDILFTSGTTGKPKGVMTAHGQNIRAFASWSELVGLRQSDRYLIVNPFFHSFGYKAGWLASILRGATMLPHPVFDVPQVLERIGKEGVSVLPGPPTLYQSILAHPERKNYDLSNLRMAATGAAAIPVELIHQMRDDLGFETVVTAYGLTEACGLATVCYPDDDAAVIATTSGRAVKDVEVRCVNSEGQEVPAGEPGEVVIRGYNVMQGYWNNPEETQKTIDADQWLHTGDIGVMDAKGYLRITDRIKDMFIMGGFNCYPAEIENQLYQLEGVAQVAVIGIPDERMGEVAMAFVVLHADAKLTPEEIIAWSRENMANYKVPRRVEIVDSLPTNASGKVVKFQLRERVAKN